MNKQYLASLLLPLLLLAGGAQSAAADKPEQAATRPSDSEAASKPAGEYLEIFKEFSGRCQGLRRGDIRMIRNTHPDKNIQFRMVRLLSGQRQASIIQDIIKPGEKNAQKLGCETLGDREQMWKVIQAKFVE